MSDEPVKPESPPMLDSFGFWLIMLGLTAACVVSILLVVYP
jgi:hypothetical protein